MADAGCCYAIATVILGLLMSRGPASEPTTESPANEPTAQSPADQTACDRYAAVDGSDEAKGTESEPFRTVQTLVHSLGPGETGCLRAGTYDAPRGAQIANGGTVDRRVVLRSAPNERATIKGRIWVEEGADYVTVRDLNLVGTNSLGDLEQGEGLPSPDCERRPYRVDQ